MILSCRKISFGYESGKQLLSEVSFELKENFSLGITGPSGKGKSTLAKIIAGHLRPTAGEIFLFGKEVTAKPNHKIILIHQSSDLFAWQTVRAHLKFVCNDEEKIDRGACPCVGGQSISHYL
jgi:ABC-type multidrug transport system ATPase subunit